MRSVRNINEGWKFTRQDEQDAVQAEFDDSGWEDVSIPHTWNAIDGANGKEYYQNPCWYRRAFMVGTQEQDQRVFVEFQGSNSITDVYVNGHHVGQHRGGYSTFRFDITEVVSFGRSNILTVKVDNTVVDDVYPQMADFTFFGGIYRDVNIVVVNHIHVDLLDYGSQGIYVIQEQVTVEQASLVVRSKLVNHHNEDKKIRLWVDIVDATGNPVAYAADEVMLTANGKTQVDLPIVMDEPTLWHGAKNPYMYAAIVSLQSYNDTVDSLTIPFGVRSFHVDAARGFFLNGEHYPLRGVSRHQDRKDRGWALNAADQREDMELIKEVGATSIRLAHYQHNQYFYDLCDCEGMVVWAEIPFISVMPKTDQDGANAKQQMIELIRQNFNHPSIVVWGIQNEIQIGGDRPEVRKVVKELHALTKKEDPTRLTTMANVMFIPDEDEYNHITDTVGLNKYYGWYTGVVGDFADAIDQFHRTNPETKLCISEYGAEGIIQYHTDDPQMRDYTEEYHAWYHEEAWKVFSKRPFLWATYVWNMFDFGANIRDEGGVVGRNNKGLVTYDRKVKKDAFFLYKAHWSAEKFVHITGKRFVERAGDSMEVKVYSNCETVTLFVNGDAIETKTGSDKVFVFAEVPLQREWTRIEVLAASDGVSHRDSASFKKVAVPNPSYAAPLENRGHVPNWFQRPELEDVEVHEIEVGDDVYSTRCTFGEIYQNEAASAVLAKYLGDITDSPKFSMLEGLTIDMLAGFAPDMFNDKVKFVLNRELTKIKKPN